MWRPHPSSALTSLCGILSIQIIVYFTHTHTHCTAFYVCTHYPTTTVHTRWTDYYNSADLGSTHHTVYQLPCLATAVTPGTAKHSRYRYPTTAGTPAAPSHAAALDAPAWPTLLPHPTLHHHLRKSTTRIHRCRYLYAVRCRAASAWQRSAAAVARDAPFLTTTSATGRAGRMQQR